MTLIYLDTSNFSLLSLTKIHEPQKYQDFIAKWKKNNYLLAFTTAHLDELLRAECSDERETRFKILEDLLPFRFESRLTDKEFLLAFIEKKIIESRFNDIDLFPQMFSQVISNLEDLNLLRVFNFDGYRQLIDLYYKATEISWKTNSKSTVKKTDKQPRLSDLPNSPMSDEMKRSMDESVEIMKSELKNFSNFPTEFLEGGQSFVLEMLKDFTAKADQVGFQQAFAEFIGANSDNNKSLKSPVTNLMKDFWFSLLLDDFIGNFLGVSDFQSIQNLKASISIKDCSGIWLSEQVKNQLKLAKDSKASNEKDIQHISHLPYVDMFLTDRRIVEAFNQVARKDSFIESLKGAALPISISNNIDSLKKVLFEK